MVTLAFGEMLFYLFHDTKIGGGSDGPLIYFKPELAIGGWTILDLENAGTSIFVALAALVLAALLVQALVRSPFGLALAGRKENERRALSLGFRSSAYRLTAFVISAMIAAVAASSPPRSSASSPSDAGLALSAACW